MGVLHNMERGWDNIKEYNAPFVVGLIFIGVLGLSLQVIGYLLMARSRRDQSALVSKVQQSKSMVQEYEKRQSKNALVRFKSKLYQRNKRKAH
jgi:hypothetical protein